MPKDIEAYNRGELVEPIKPIVYYIDPPEDDKNSSPSDSRFSHLADAPVDIITCATFLFFGSFKHMKH